MFLYSFRLSSFIIILFNNSYVVYYSKTNRGLNVNFFSPSFMPNIADCVAMETNGGHWMNFDAVS